MEFQKAVKDFFKTEERESAQHVAEFEAQQATWESVKAEIERVDREECIPPARELAALQLAGSPRMFEVEGGLRKARLKRDGIRWAFQRKLDDLRNRCAADTRQDISNFHLNCLDRAKGLSRHYRFTRLDTLKDAWTDKKTVRISSNFDALQAARDRIFEGVKEVRGLELRPLAEVRRRIRELQLEFNSFDLAVLRVEEVSETAAQDMRPKSTAVAAGYEKLAELSARIGTLEGKRS
jgi:hypothetical protein